VKVAVTGAAGQIGYSLLFRIASGSMLGPDQPVELRLIEIPSALKALEGVVMELADCAFPLVTSMIPTTDLDEGFRGINWALLVVSVPRKYGMERKELLGINGKIFTGQGRAIETICIRDHLHHHASLGSGGIDRFRQAPESGLGCLNPFHDRQDIAERTRELSRHQTTSMSPFHVLA
jgi:hypothetical protein